MENQEMGWIYIIEATDQELYKIGKTFNLKKRLSSLQCASPYTLRVIHKFQSEHLNEVEVFLHKIFSGKRFKREWFRLSEVDLAFLSQVDGYDKSLVWKASRVNIENLNFKSDLFSVVVPNMRTSTGELKDITLSEGFIKDFLDRAWRRQGKNKNGLSARYWIRSPYKKIVPSAYEAMIVLLTKNHLIADRYERRSGKLIATPLECFNIIKSNSGKCQ